MPFAGMLLKRGQNMSGLATPVDPAPRPDLGCPRMPPSAAAIDYVSRLQRDGRLLLNFITRRSDRSPMTGGVEPDQPHPPVELLLADPACVACDAAKLARLVAYVDILSRRAWPATVSTINITNAYLKARLPEAAPPAGKGAQPAGGAGQPPPADAALSSSESPQVRHQAALLRRTMKRIRLFAMFAAALSVLLLMHVDDGRRAVQQLGLVRAELDGLYADLTKLDAEKEWFFHPAARGQPPAEPPRVFVPYCKPRVPAFRGPEDERADNDAKVERKLKEETWREPRTTQSNAACGRLGQAQLREDLVYARLATWNARNEMLLPQHWFRVVRQWIESLLGYPAPAIPGGPEIAWPATISVSAWQQTELRTNSNIAVLSGYVLPMLLGCIGGCVHALRRVNDKLANWTLEELDAPYSVLRVLLATTLGGLLGLIWNADAPVQVGGLSLSLAAVAFFIGFSLEVVFDVIDAMVRGASDKLRGPARPPADLPGAPGGQSDGGRAP